MATATIDFSDLMRGLPAGAWVAISERTNSVLAYAAELQTVIQKARENGEEDPLIVRIPEQTSVLFL
jgi:hypothetical protein